MRNDGLAAGFKPANTAYLRLGSPRIQPRHSIAVLADSTTTPGETETWIHLRVCVLDPAPVAAAFDPDDGLCEHQRYKPAGSYLKLCIGAEGHECGIDFAHREPTRKFCTGGCGQLSLSTQTPQRIAGELALDKQEGFFEEIYQFDPSLDAVITPAPGTALTAFGGEPGRAYQTYRSALAQGDFDQLRARPASPRTIRPRPGKR